MVWKIDRRTAIDEELRKPVRERQLVPQTKVIEPTLHPFRLNVETESEATDHGFLWGPMQVLRWGAVKYDGVNTTYVLVVQAGQREVVIAVGPDGEEVGVDVDGWTIYDTDHPCKDIFGESIP